MMTSPSENEAPGSEGDEQAGGGTPDLGETEALTRYLRQRRVLVDEALERFFPPPQRWPEQLHSAASWALYGGGKRLRPVLALAAFEAVGGTRDLPWDAVLPAACAVEMVHTYSLVHDDLPCMDADVERRGRPTVHVKYGEGMALLAGDALLTEAFALLGNLESYRGAASAEQALEATRMLGRAAGWQGMVGGQSIDLGFEFPVDDETALTFLHRRKTGELFRFSTAAGALFGDGSPDQIRELGEYGELLGLAFQISDDLLDADEDAGEREASPTPSYPGLLGRDAAQERCEELLDRCLELLADYGEEATPLRRLAWFAVHRDH
ncbi:MAG: polyprenyl synthetase family protein [Myxococcota bacterium]|nr:polyprenyl synthetase family protein [Myxococcota bacterium]